MEVLRGQTVVLRAMRPDDADDLAAGCDDALTQRFLPFLPSPYTRGNAHWWITEGAPAAVGAGGWAYGFADPDTDRLIGGGGGQRRRDSAGEIGYWVAPWARNRGVATEAARLLATHVFSQGVERLVLHTQPENTASQRVALAAGFTREGIARGNGLESRRFAPRRDRVGSARHRLRRAHPTSASGPARRRADRRRGDPATARRGGCGQHPRVAVATRRGPHIRTAGRSGPRRDHAEVCPSPVGLARRSTRRLHHPGCPDWHVCGRDRALLLGNSDPAGDDRLQPRSALARPGFTTRAVNIVADWAFARVGIIRLIAGTAPDNVASHRVLERAGFEREGYHRGRLPGPNGTRIDDIQWVRFG